MKLFFALALMILTNVGASAQEKTIKQEEFDTIYKNSFRVLGNNPRRETQIHQTNIEVLPQADKQDGSYLISPNKTYIKTVTEFLPTDGYRSVSEFNAPSANKKIERINLSGKTYTRENNGNWIEENSKNIVVSNVKTPLNPNSETRHQTIIDRTEYKYLGNELLENQPAEVFTKTDTGRVVNPKDNSETAFERTTKYWFGKNGMLLKTEQTGTRRSKFSVMKTSLITTIEIDPRITIEAPPIN